MKTKIIPFDLEIAQKIQAGKIEGKIKMRGGEREMRIVCYDSTAEYCGKIQPIIAQSIEDCTTFYAYFKDGAYVGVESRLRDLVLEVPDNESKFKPFDKVLVRTGGNEIWRAAIYSHFEVVGEDSWHVTIDGCIRTDGNIIPYKGHENLLGTTKKPEEE